MAATIAAGRQLTLTSALLASGKILLGNAGNIAAAVTPSGDVTIDNTGVTAIGAGKITAAMLGTSLDVQFDGIGIGTPPVGSQAVRIIKTPVSSGGNAFGVACAITGDSSATGTVAGYTGQVVSTATTTTRATGFQAAANTVTSGTQTESFGFYSQNQSSGVTTAGFGHDVTAGTGKYGFFGRGTATNYFNATMLIGTTSIPTSATFNVVLGGGATSPVLGAAQADCCSFVAADSAATDRNIYARNEAGQRNRLTGLGCYVATDFAKTSDTTLANVTGLTRNVEAGFTYAFEAVLYTTSNVAGGIKCAIAGTATATGIIYEADVVSAGVLQSPGTSRASALGTTVGDVTAATVAKVTITGHIVVNAAGTLTVQFAQNVSNGTASKVLANSFFNLKSTGG